MSLLLSLTTVAFLHFSGPNDLDFWIGDWVCTGKSLNAKGTWDRTDAKNHIERVLDQQVIQENFTMGQFKGKSWSVFNPASKSWSQTWVDNQGSYIALRGGSIGEKVILTTLPLPKKPLNFSRMVYSKVTSSSFTWDWEKSTDGGKTWKLQWELNYRRAD